MNEVSSNKYFAQTNSYGDGTGVRRASKFSRFHSVLLCFYCFWGAGSAARTAFETVQNALTAELYWSKLPSIILIPFNTSNCSLVHFTSYEIREYTWTITNVTSYNSAHMNDKYGYASKYLFRRVPYNTAMQANNDRKITV
jgi:hypothetical protein